LLVAAGSASFAAPQRELSRSSLCARPYGVSSVPTLVVDGRYMTGAGMAGSQEKTLQVVDFLIEKMRKERKLKK